jgi:uncharacterized protein YdhG (YjbR/CyaY superfamily)
MDEKVATYISTFPDNIQDRLLKLRAVILENAKGAKEHFAYSMPAYSIYNRPLVYFAAYKNHIGFYALPTGHKAFEKDFSNYKKGKGSVQFPNNDDLPLDLIRRVVLFRVEENCQNQNNVE